MYFKGFIRLLDEYYMVLITGRKIVALIGSHYVYKIEGSVILPIRQTGSSMTTKEARFVAILSMFATSDLRFLFSFLEAFQQIALSRDFYFSYTYDLTHTLQYNMHRAQPHKTADDASPFLWNDHLLSCVPGSLRYSGWFTFLIHGFVEQRSISSVPFCCSDGLHCRIALLR